MNPPSPPVLLLVEDDPEDAWFLRRAMNALPLRVAVDVAASVPEARAYLGRILEDPARTIPSLILSDVNLPGGTAWDLLEWARRCATLAAVPLLVWTSLPNPEGEDRARALRAVRYVGKPRDPAGYRRMALLVAEHLGD